MQFHEADTEILLVVCLPCYHIVCLGAKLNFLTVLTYFQLYFNNKIHSCGKLIQSFLMTERRYNQLSLALQWGAAQEVCSSGESILDVSGKMIVTKIRPQKKNQSKLK